MATTIGDRIKTLREQHSLSQEALASFLGTTKQTIYKYERGIITNIPSDKIELLAEVLHTTPEWIMGWENETGLSPSSENGFIHPDFVVLLQDESSEIQSDVLALVECFLKCDAYNQGKILAYAQGISEKAPSEEEAIVQKYDPSLHDVVRDQLKVRKEYMDSAKSSVPAKKSV